MNRDNLIEVIREFTGTILNPYDLPDLLHRLSAHAVSVVGAAGAGILLEDSDGDVRFAAATDDRVVDLEVTQERIRSGACFEAYASNTLVVIDDLATAGRWDEYTQRAVMAGFGAVIGIPMNAFGRTIGVINIYREQSGPWSTEDVEAAEILASMGAGYIVNASQMRAQNDLTEQLHAAIESRDIIGQAKGILMANRGVDAQTAFGLLRTASQTRNHTLRKVAELVVERREEI